jgi:hypothetical protein
MMTCNKVEDIGIQKKRRTRMKIWSSKNTAHKYLMGKVKKKEEKNHCLDLEPGSL